MSQVLDFARVTQWIFAVQHLPALLELEQFPGPTPRNEYNLGFVANFYEVLSIIPCIFGPFSLHYTPLVILISLYACFKLLFLNKWRQYLDVFVSGFTMHQVFFPRCEGDKIARISPAGTRQKSD